MTEPLSQLSREIAFRCDARGVVVWADDRAKDLLGPIEGKRLEELCPECGAEEFFARAKSARVMGVPLVARTGGKDIRLMLNAEPSAAGISLVATWIGAKERGGQAEFEKLSSDLRDSQRGLMTLYQELDDKSDSLRRANDVKGRVIANVSHEFRTPLNSITGLARLLLSRVDGPLTPEQEKQVNFILKSADELSLLVTDLLDLSKIEAGKTQLRPIRFDVEALFAGLRGMMRPVHQNPNVELIFEADKDVPELETDESKISQILRNLLSNAIKFTEKGEIRLSARNAGDGKIAFEVKDSGIGIAPEDHSRVFEEFSQLESPIQRQVKGTGLGLSLSRKLAEFLGGTLTLKSSLGEGATFTLTIPAVHEEVMELVQLNEKAQKLDPFKSPILVVEDDRQTLFLYEKYLQGSGFQVVPARTVDDARLALKRMRPAAVVLDVMLEGETTWSFLNDLKQNAETRDIPVLVVTVTDREQKARALGADEFWLKPMDQNWLLKKLRGLARHGPVERVLVIDDDEVARYLIRRLLADTQYAVVEAAGGHEGIRLARESQPQVILLDFVLPDMSAFDVIDDLKTHPATRMIPVIIHTSRDLDEGERQRLSRDATAILQKQALSRELALGRIRDALVKAGIVPVQ